MEKLFIIKFLFSLFVVVFDFLSNVFELDFVEVDLVVPFFTFLNLAFRFDDKAVCFLVGKLLA